MFANWLAGVPIDVVPSGATPPMKVTAWYSEFLDRTDIELRAKVNGASIQWSLSFEPWTPIDPDDGKDYEVLSLSDLLEIAKLTKKA